MGAVGFLWVVAAILVVTNASTEVWLASGIAGGSLAIVNALQRRTVKERSRFPRSSLLTHAFQYRRIQQIHRRKVASVSVHDVL